MDHLQQFLKEYYRGAIRRLVDALTVSRLYSLKVPGAILIPEEFVDAHQRIGDPELGIMVLDDLDCLVQFIFEPYYCQPIDITLLKFFVNCPALNKTERVPDLVAEIPALLNLRLIIEYVVAG